MINLALLGARTSASLEFIITAAIWSVLSIAPGKWAFLWHGRVSDGQYARDARELNGAARRGMRKSRGLDYFRYEVDTAQDNVSSPRAESSGVHGEDTKNWTPDNGGTVRVCVWGGERNVSSSRRCGHACQRIALSVTPSVKPRPLREKPAMRRPKLRRAAGCSLAGLVFHRGRVRREYGFVEFGAPALLGEVVMERSEAEPRQI